jgi:hypothetical protein
MKLIIDIPEETYEALKSIAEDAKSLDPYSLPDIIINKSKPLDDLRPQGEWIWSPVADDGTVSGCCNKCSFSHMFIGGHTAQYNFCPNCGAKMTGGVKNDSKRT